MRSKKEASVNNSFSSMKSNKRPRSPSPIVNRIETEWVLVGCKPGITMTESQKQRIGEHEGYVISNPQGFFVYSSSVARQFSGKDCYLFRDIASKCKIKARDRVKFDVHVSSKGEPQCKAPFWVLREKAQQGDDFARNNFARNGSPVVSNGDVGEFIEKIPNPNVTNPLKRLKTGSATNPIGAVSKAAGISSATQSVRNNVPMQHNPPRQNAPQINPPPQRRSFTPLSRINENNTVSSQGGLEDPFANVDLDDPFEDLLGDIGNEDPIEPIYQTNF